MKRFSQFQKGLVIIIIGLALIFPFISRIILKNIAVFVGFFLVLTGIKLLLFTKKSKRERPNQEHEYQDYNEKE